MGQNCQWGKCRWEKESRWKRTVDRENRNGKCIGCKRCIIKAHKGVLHHIHRDGIYHDFLPLASMPFKLDREGYEKGAFEMPGFSEKARLP